jgi:hypothetical protein
MSMSARNEVRLPPRRQVGTVWRLGAIAGLCALSIAPAWSQASPELRQILDRLDRLEAQNQALTAEVHALREQLAARGGQPAPEPTAEAAAPTVEERLEVQETRTSEQAETKVESAHRLPLRISGMALFNTYFNSNGGDGGAQYPTTVTAGQPPSGGATFRQSIVGLDYSGPQAFGGGKISGSLRLDLFGGTAANPYVRLRTASLAIDWKTSSFLVGVDKPLISQREPESLAQVGISPLSGAGNLWYWIPQARFTQDFQFSSQSGMRAQIGVVQTQEVAGSAANAYGAASTSASYFESTRPGVEARLEFFDGENQRIEIAPGFHHSVSHVAGASVPSDIYTVDWLMRPSRLLEFTGEAFAGQNVAPLGAGGLPGIVVTHFGLAAPVHTLGGWGQITFHATPRLWFNVFSGQQDDRNSDLPAGGIGKNLAYGSNVFFRLASNVLTSFEASQVRTSYIGSRTLGSNHYDLALAYLF